MLPCYLIISHSFTAPVHVPSVDVGEGPPQSSILSIYLLKNGVGVSVRVNPSQ